MEQIRVEDGKITIDLGALLSQMDGDSKREMVSALGWDDDVWDNLKTLACEEYAGTNYNPSIYELREAMMKSGHFGEIIAKVTRELLYKITYLEHDLSIERKYSYAWQYWYENRFQSDSYQPLPVNRERSDVSWFKDDVAIEFLKSQGLLLPMDEDE